MVAGLRPTSEGRHARQIFAAVDGGYPLKFAASDCEASQKVAQRDGNRLLKVRRLARLVHRRTAAPATRHDHTHHDADQQPHADADQ